MKNKTPVSPAFHILLDTNALYTEHAAKLLSAEISDFILNGAKALGLGMTWYLPKIVKAERRRQMINEGNKLLSPLRKLEMLLGMNLAINEDTVVHRVDAVIAEHVAEHGLVECDAPHAEIDWDRLIDAAVNKVPPFSPGEKNEKGFKDAIVLEAFCRLVATVPKSRKSARAVLVTNDGLLAEAAKGRTNDHSNVLIVADLAELKGHLNAQASQIDETLVPTITEAASKLFFRQEHRDESYFVRENLSAKIREKYGEAMNKSPRPDFAVRVKDVRISASAISSKTGQTIVFQNRIRYVLVASREVLETAPPDTNPLLPFQLQAEKSSHSPLAEALAGLADEEMKKQRPLGLLAGSLIGRTKVYREEISGEMVAIVTWRAIISATLRLSKPRLLEISASDPVWSQEITKVE